MQQQYVERVVDLTEAEANQIYRLSVEEAKEIVLNGSAEAVGRIAGSFALVARAGKTVKMARSLDRPLRYFLAKRQAGPVLIVSARIDAITSGCKPKDSKRSSTQAIREWFLRITWLHSS